MRHLLRPTVQVAATLVAAAAVSHITDPARRSVDAVEDDSIAEPDERPDVVRQDERGDREAALEPVPVYHSFGPEPVAVARVAYQPDRAAPKPEVEEARKPALYVLKPPAAESGNDAPEVDLHQPEQPQPQPQPEPEPEPEPMELTRRLTGRVHGSVTNVHGRGLRGMRVEIVSSDKTAVASTRTTDGGRFIVDDVPPGDYFLRAFDDVDGDFEKSWFGGRKLRSAESFMVAAERPVDRIDVVLRSTAQIDVEATAGERKTEVVVRVTHRATGAPATGEVELSTKNSDHIIAALVDGQAYITFTDGDMPPVTKVRVSYSGDHETRPASTKAKVN